MKNILFLNTLVFSLLCFTAQAQLTGQGKVTHDGYDAMSGDYHGLVFEATKPFTLIDVEVWSAGSGGDLIIELHNSDGVVLEYISVRIPGRASKAKPIPVTVRLDWKISPGKNYRLLATSSPELMYDHLPSVGGAYAYPIGNVGRVNSGFTQNSYNIEEYYFFYNWTVQY